MKARIAFMHKPFDLRIEDVELPEIKANQILVKVGACGICGSDVHCYEGKSAEGRYDIAPYTPGHEWGGTIVEAGKDVRGLKVGDKVTGDCVMACGVCANCKEGLMPSACLNMREAGFRPDSPGGMGTYLIIEEQYAHAIPADWPEEMGAWVETFSIGYFGIWGNGGYIDASDTCLILGAGPVGVSAAMVSKTSGAKTIVADPNPIRREWAKKYGADIVLDSTASDYREKLNEATDGRGPSVLVECSGNDAAIASIFDIAGHSCRVNLVGHSIGHKIPVEIGKTIWSTLKIKGSGGTKDWAQRTIRFMNAIKDQYDFAALNTHHIPFEQLNEAMDLAMNHPEEAFKVMLTFD
ncbi:zinc-dependent alcohol dehydrogenase [Christensenella timonensis]|uniref:zinc-dependent alcohol dehydrogenase n=1 Tax=Christensenella timonensis TaxID=1816678 RepID=UPI00082FDFC0|nr:alcohol dehydrogenase catalytic domain-containing protein [Christensenella timonensis]